MFYHESWKPIYFGVKRSKSQKTQKHCSSDHEDVDSAQRQKTYCDLDSGDGMEVDVAALQLHLTQLNAEHNNYKSLYSQTEENDNYQEQILGLTRCMHYVTNSPLLTENKVLCQRSR